MKRGPLCAALLVVLFAGCIIDPRPPSNDKYTLFPKAEILQAGFYYQRDGKDVSGDEAGTIEANEDGTYKVRMRRRSPSNVPTLMHIGLDGSFNFSEYYKIVCTFPDDPAVTDKPYRVYACGSRALDGNADADYPTASDLKGTAVFKNGVAIGTFEMTNEGVNLLNPDKRDRPYTTVFLYLYFNNVSDPDDWYEFTLDYVGGAKASMPESVVTKAETYRGGDTVKCEAVVEKYEVTDPDTGTVETKNFILADYNHRFESRKAGSAVTVKDTNSLCVDLTVPDADAGKDIEFEFRGAGVFSGDDTNLLTRAMFNAAKVLAAAGGEQTGVTVTETRIIGTQTYYYVVKAKTVKYSDMTGVKLVIGGTDNFTGTDRFSCTVKLPEEYGWK
jgi:hypothetical protein